MLHVYGQYSPIVLLYVINQEVEKIKSEVHAACFIFARVARLAALAFFVSYAWYARNKFILVNMSPVAGNAASQHHVRLLWQLMKLFAGHSVKVTIGDMYLNYESASFCAVW